MFDILNPALVVVDTAQQVRKWDNTPCNLLQESASKAWYLWLVCLDYFCFCEHLPKNLWGHTPTKQAIVMVIGFKQLGRIFANDTSISFQIEIYRWE